MSKLDDLIPLSETVLWRWPRRLGVGTGRLVRLATLVMLGLLGALWYIGQPGWQFLGILALPIAMNLPGYMSWSDRVRAIAVTPQWIVISRGLLRRRAERIEKRKFERATLWEHRGHLNLHRSGRETLKVQDIGKSDGLVAALGLPTRVWPKREAAGPGRSILHLTVGLFFVLWLAGLASVPALMILYGDTVGAWPSEVVAGIGIVVGAVVGYLILSGVVAGVAGIVLARIAGGDALAQFIHAAGDPAWRGEKTEPGLTFRYLNALARLTGAEPVEPDTVEPVIVNGPLPGRTGGAA